MGGALLYNTYFTAFSKQLYADKAAGILPKMLSGLSAYETYRIR